MTNREWIESLSDEELAQEILRVYTHALCEVCSYSDQDCDELDMQTNCTNGITKWLQAEHREKED